LEALEPTPPTELVNLPNEPNFAYSALAVTFPPSLRRILSRPWTAGVLEKVEISRGIIVHQEWI